jgi:hypothetical protein
LGCVNNTPKKYEVVVKDDEVNLPVGTKQHSLYSTSILSFAVVVTTCPQLRLGDAADDRHRRSIWSTSRP